MLRPRHEFTVASHIAEYLGQGAEELSRGLYLTSETRALIAIVSAAPLGEPARRAARRAQLTDDVALLVDASRAARVVGPSGAFTHEEWQEELCTRWQQLDSSALVRIEVWIADSEPSAAALLYASPLARAALDSVGYDVDDEGLLREKLALAGSDFPSLLAEETDAAVASLMKDVS